jgi:hypothetical protein
MFVRAFFAAAAVVLLTGSSMAQDAQRRSDPAAKPAEKKICHNIVPTGTIVAKRFCLTKTEWRQFHDINEKSAAIALERRRGNLEKPTMGDPLPAAR